MERENKFILGDCMDPATGLPSYPDNFFDLAIVDPPYGIGEDGRNAKSRSNKERIRKRRNGEYFKVLKTPNYHTSNWDDNQPNQNYFNELFRVSKHQIIWGSNYLKFDQKESSSGRIIWDKVNSGDFSDCEIAWTSLFSSVRQIEYMWNGMLQGLSLKQGRCSQGNRALCEKRTHPTQKPKLLYYWLLDNYAQPGDLILDTHVGSASSLIACESMGFNYVGYEIDPEYYQEAKKRMAKGIQKALF